jgi:hypothetical protein
MISMLLASTSTALIVDEVGADTSLAPLYARSRRGERALARAPRNRGSNVTLPASMGVEGMGPCLAVEGPTTREGVRGLPETGVGALAQAGAGGGGGDGRPLFPQGLPG